MVDIDVAATTKPMALASLPATMELGVCNFEPRYVLLAQAIGATWARVQVDLSDGIPEASLGAVAAARQCGLEVVCDVRTTMQRLGQMLYAEGDPLQNKAIALDWFASQIMDFLDEVPCVRHIEIWGSAECAHVVHGEGIMLDYSRVLSDVYERVKAAKPEVIIWTGGFGQNCQFQFLQSGLCEYAPQSFDVLNWHPFVSTSGTLEMDLATCGARLERARELTQAHCANQPFASTGFGLPSLPAPLPEYAGDGGFVHIPGSYAIPRSELAAWYKGFLWLFEEHGFRTLMLLPQDRYEPIETGRKNRYFDYCGLLNVNGEPKEFVEEIGAWNRDRA